MDGAGETRQTQLRCELERNMRRICELETTVAAGERAAAERDAMRDVASDGVAVLEQAKRKQTDVFADLIGRYRETRTDDARARERLAAEREANGRMSGDVNGLARTLVENRAAAQETRAAVSALKCGVRRAEDRLAEAVARRAAADEALRRTEAAVADRQCDAATARHGVAEQAARNAETETRVRAARAQGVCLRAAVADTRAEGERLEATVRSEVCGARDALADRTAELADAEQLLCAERRAVEDEADRRAGLEDKRAGLRNACDKERLRAADETCRLRTEAETLAARLSRDTAALCRALAENDRLRCASADREAAAEAAGAAERRLRLSAQRDQQTAELASQKLAGERCQRANEARLLGRKLELMARERHELGQQVEDRARTVARLRLQATGHRGPDDASQRVPGRGFASVLDSYVNLLCDDDDDGRGRGGGGCGGGGRGGRPQRAPAAEAAD